MQLPSTLDGLKAQLKALGYPTVLDGVDLSTPLVKDMLIAQMRWEFTNARSAPGNKGLLDKAISLIERFPLNTPTNPYGLCPQCGAPGEQRERRPNGNDRCQNSHTYPSREAVMPQTETAPAPKNAPEPKIMKVVEFDKPAQEVVLEHVQGKLAEAARRGALPLLNYGVAKANDKVEVLAGDARDRARSFLNLPVVLAEVLQGRGFLPAGMERYHGYYAAIEQKVREVVKAAASSESTFKLSAVAEKAVEDEVLGAYLSVMGHDRPLFSTTAFARDPTACIEAYKTVLKRAGYSEVDMAPPKRRRAR